ncbi:MAG: hypothetical protein HY064_04730 [Bacteroidetes bacterium]|nr:hypothetical protein [Bacteroidota bacterium]
MKRFFTPVLVVSTVLAVGTTLFINGCKKTPVDTETTSATDNNICEGEFMRMLPAVNKITIDEPGMHRVIQGAYAQSSCPTVTVDTNNGAWPRYMTIDYGTGCTDTVDGKIRKGKIRMTLSDPWDYVGAIATMSLDTFFVGAIQYQGTITLTRTGVNSWHKVVTNGKCTKGTDWTILFDCDRNITFSSGSTVSTDPQIITITGSNHGTDRNGKTWTSTITSPIVRDLSCSWITKGTFELTPDGKSTRTVDFGNGTCDNKGTISIDGNTFEFTMN